MIAVGGTAVAQAASRFVAFFRELEGAFIERADVLKQIALALLSRQHVLMTGPPGTAKSQLAHRVLGRIRCEVTGQPSLFARQFTESTVQTDLVGPIDFKTLMETGRTHHFTDEGILGAVHAFLDEVFDGRDMLLRSALNVLHERELKEGTKTTPGKIECALMTTNRYLAEILDNERLIAFVDRIAFVSFVPKGFARPEALEQVLRAQVAGQRPPDLQARLTIQDLDVLQRAVDAVHVDETVCAALAALIQAFESEVAAARRGNPTFVPSRYLSTRTVVRMGTLLRAVSFYDRLFGDEGRSLQTTREDLAELRLAMTLCGPSAEEAAQLLQRETDPRERRQLTILRTEQEIFDRCLASLPASARVVVQTAPATDRLLLAEASPIILPRTATSRLLELSRAFAVAASSGRPDADEARLALERVMGETVERALRSGFSTRSDEELAPEDLVAQLIALAADLEPLGRTGARAARWLRGRALETIDRAVAFTPLPLGQVLASMVGVSGDVEALHRPTDASLGRMERLAELRAGLRHAGVDEPDPAASDLAWKQAAQRLADGMLPVLQAGLAAAARRLLEPIADGDLTGALAALAPATTLAARCRDRLTALGGAGPPWFTAVMGPLVAPVAQRAYETVPSGARDEVVSAIEQRTAVLAAARLLEVLPPAELMRWSIDAFLRAGDPALPATGDGALDVEGYRRLRAAAGHATLASALVDLYLKLVPSAEPLDPDLIVGSVAEIVGALPSETRADLVRRDQAQLEAVLGYVERWWASLSRHRSGAEGSPEDVPSIEALVRSRFFEVTHDEGALTRFALEVRLSAMVFGEDPNAPLLDRIAAIERATSEAARRALTAGASRRRSDPVPASDGAVRASPVRGGR